MNPRKMLALLGPRSPQLTRLMHRSLGGETVRTPLSPVDVAHALAYIGNPLAVRVYQATWCPGWDLSPAMPRLVEDLARMLLSETRDRERRRDRRRPPFPPCPKAWQAAPLDGLRKLVALALFELAHPGDCETCMGYGMTAHFDPEIKKLRADTCAVCEGRGYLPYPKHRRAALLHIRYKTYLDRLQAPYDWLLRELRHLERTAADAHYRAMDTGNRDDGYVEPPDDALARTSIARR